MKIKIPKFGTIRFLLFFSFNLSIVIETLVQMKLIADSNLTKMVQYIILLLPVGICLIKNYFFKGKKRRLFLYELYSIGIVVVSFLIISLHRSVLANHFTFESIMQLFQIAVPFIFTYVLLNTLNEYEISLFMKVALWMTIIGYSCAVFGNISSLEEILNISIFNSYSPFENSTYAEIANGLAVYFVYFRKKMPYYCMLSILLNLMIFKRVLMLMVIILFIITIIKDKYPTIPRWLYNVSIIGWVGLIYSTYNLYLPQNASYIKLNYGIDLSKFTMSRILRLWYLIENCFVSYGLGSTTEYIESLHLSYLGHELEMDFIRIMYELGIIAVIVFIYIYLRITKRNIYSFCLMNLCFLNLLMANGLVKYWGWTMRILTIGLINYYEIKDNKGNVDFLKLIKRVRRK